MLLTRAGEPLCVERTVQVALHERLEGIVEGDGGVAGDVGIRPAWCGSLSLPGGRFPLGIAQLTRRNQSG